MKKFILVLAFLLSNVISAQEKSNLIFKEGIYAIEVKLEKGYLELGKENKIQFLIENINPVNMSCSARGLRRGDLPNGSNNIINWIAKVDNESLKDGKYSIHITFRGRKGKLFNHVFLIEVK